MKKGFKAHNRNNEIVAFFYAIFSSRIRQGAKAAVARKAANDAVELRYGISSGRLTNIISEQKTSRLVNPATLRMDALALIKSIDEVNGGLDAMKRRNEELVSLLKEYLDEC